MVTSKNTLQAISLHLCMDIAKLGQGHTWQQPMNNKHFEMLPIYPQEAFLHYLTILADTGTASFLEMLTLSLPGRRMILKLHH